MEEWEDAGDSQAEAIAAFILNKVLPCDRCESNQGRIYPCDYGHCLHGYCANCKAGLFCMDNLDTSVIDCPCCSDEQIHFPDGKVPWYYRSFPISIAIGWLSGLLPEERAESIRSRVLEGLTRTHFPDFYDIKIPEDFGGSDS